MNTSNKIGLKKLTIAKINTQWMNAIKGGSSVTNTEEPATVGNHGVCPHWR